MLHLSEIESLNLKSTSVSSVAFLYCCYCASAFTILSDRVALVMYNVAYTG